YDLTITVNGLSKSYSMTGWRIGYMGAPLDVAAAVSNLQDHTTSNPNSIAQKAAVAALSAPADFTNSACAEFLRKRDYIISRLKTMPMLKYSLPLGAFYVFCDISKTKLDSATFASRLLEETYVSLIPGKGFGMDDYIRMSFATSMEQLAKGMDRLGQWLAKL
ncbi:MAG: aminotransferase class I/II-fold pyridoxal phosphate-dependent enzyme, partial [Candidatus Omnitrophota bacterium]